MVQAAVLASALNYSVALEDFILMPPRPASNATPDDFSEI
jgi:hypothetical protein